MVHPISQNTYLQSDQDDQPYEETVGKDRYTLFLTADHGAANAIWYSRNHDIPADYWNPASTVDSLNRILAAGFQTADLVDTISNYQVTFNMRTIRQKKLDFNAIKKTLSGMAPPAARHYLLHRYLEPL